MKLIANYGQRNNGNSYSVTMETVEDVPKINAKDMLAVLFTIAKKAVARQMELEQGGGTNTIEAEEPGPEEKRFIEDESEAGGSNGGPC